MRMQYFLQYSYGHLHTSSADNETAEFANTVDPDEAAHNEPSHRDLHCLPFSPRILIRIQLVRNIYLNRTAKTP